MPAMPTPMPMPAPRPTPVLAALPASPPDADASRMALAAEYCMYLFMSPIAPIAARSSMAFWVSSVGLTLARNICFRVMPSASKSSLTFTLIAALISLNSPGRSNSPVLDSPSRSVRRLMIMLRR